MARHSGECKPREHRLTIAPRIECEKFDLAWSAASTRLSSVACENVHPMINYHFRIK